MVDLRVVPLSEKIKFEASKWLKLQVLLDESEFSDLLEKADAYLFEMQGEVTIAEAVSRYSLYTAALKEGKEPKPDPLAWNWTLDLEALYLLDTGHVKQVRVQKPIVQISGHQMNYTPEDNTFRSNLYGHSMISWGLQFAFPQLYEDSLTSDVYTVKDPAQFKNVLLFRFLQKWLRENTIPTPFEQVNASQRIGKKALSWVNSHPHLVKKGYKVKS